MDVSVKQYYAIKLCVFSKKHTEETILLLQEAFGNEVLGVSTIKKCHEMFLGAEFEPRGGKPKTVGPITNISTVTTAIEDNHHQLVRALAMD